MKLLISLLLSILPSFGATLVRIQCGGTGGVDAQGNVWQADVDYTGGGRWGAANQPSMATLPVPYNTLRYSNPAGSPFSYSIPVKPGNYNVTLKFVEPNKTAIAQRVFNLAISIPINGATVNQEALDLFAVAPGALVPYDLSFPIIVASGMAGIQVSVAATTGNAVLSGIQVDDDTVPPSIPTYVTGLESAAPTCPAAGLTFFYATDTDHLFRCWAGGEWKVVGDVRNAAPTALNLQECQGSGPGWSCNGVLWATFQLADNSLLQLVGAPMPDFQGSAGTTWVQKR